MRIPRIFLRSPLSLGTEIELPAKQSNYLCKALRMEAGRWLWVFNGSGGAYKAIIRDASSKKAMVEITEYEAEDRESPLRIELGIALSKGDRFDLVLQKATELGVTHISPLFTERVEVRLNKERTEKKWRHWRGIIESACEQSGRNRLPLLIMPQPFEKWAESLTQKTRITMHPDNGCSIRDLRVESSEIAVLIGPEGGLTEAEVEKAALNYGFSDITLGARVLRTETAPLAVISLLQGFFGDF